MITTALLGIGLVFLMAGVVGVLDAVHASAWRRVAAQRRDRWETSMRSGRAPSEPAVPAA